MKYLLLCIGFAAAASASDERAALEQLRKDLIDTEVVLERVKRFVPAEFDPAAETAAIAKLAKEAKIPPVGVKPIGDSRLSLRDGQPAPLAVDRVEITGRGSYEAVHFFLWMLRYRPRPIGIESARIDAAGDDEVKFVARLSYPRWIVETPPPDASTDIIGVYRRRLARERAIVETMVDLLARVRADSRLGPLAAFTESTNDDAIALTSVTLDDAIVVEGFALGAKARAALTAALEKGKLRAPRVQWTRNGTCDAFTLTATAEPVEDEEFTSGRSVFDADAAALCRGEQQAARRKVVVRPAKASEGFVLRLRDADIADVFFVLNDLIAEDFVIDGDVKGRIDLDVPEGATVDETLDALRSPEVLIGSEPLRSVSRTKRAAAKAGAAGEPINVSFRDAYLSDVLCLLGRIAGREELRMARDQQRKISFFATEMPVGVAIDALATGGTSGVKSCEVATPSRSRLPAYPLQLEEMGVDDLRVAGIAHFADTWKAYVYGPRRRLMIVEPGQKLYDGTVKSIGADGVTFASGSGASRLVPLTP